MARRSYSRDPGGDAPIARLKTDGGKAKQGLPTLLLLEQQPRRELPEGAPGVEGALEDLGAGVAGRHVVLSPA